MLYEVITSIDGSAVGIGQLTRIAQDKVEERVEILLRCQRTTDLKHTLQHSRDARLIAALEQSQSRPERGVDRVRGN